MSVFYCVDENRAMNVSKAIVKGMIWSKQIFYCVFK